jgi:hypothetical protein
MKDARKFIGKSFRGVTLELVLDEGLTRPRVCPVDTFGKSLRVEFPRALREQNHIGTQFLATVKVCQKHVSASGAAKGAPYLRASDIQRLDKTVPKRGLRAKKSPGTTSGRSYVYAWEKTRKAKGRP